MKKTILVVNPWIYDFAAYDFWIKPLGLLYLAACLRQNGYAVRLADCLDPYHPEMASEPFVTQPKRKLWGQGKYAKEKISKPAAFEHVPRSYHRYGITPRLFAEELRRGPRPDMVLVTSMMTYWYPGVFEAIRIIAGILPDAPIVLGGHYATLCHDHAVRNSGAQVVISGEGERKIAARFKEMFNDDFEFVPEAQNLDTFPYPAFDLIRRLDQVPILTSRGCPFRCTYCASHLLNSGFRRRDPLKVADEITFWNGTKGIRDFSIYDDAFLAGPSEMAFPLLREIVKRGLAVRFHCPNGLHLRDVNDDLARLLFRAGFVTIRFGFETSDAASQRERGGKASNQDLKEAVRSLKKAGYASRDIGVYLLCGLPGQSAAEVRESIRFVQRCGARPILAEFSPIPGTGLWPSAVDVSPYPIEEEPLFHNNTLLPCSSGHLSHEHYRALKSLAQGRSGPPAPPDNTETEPPQESDESFANLPPL